MSTNDTEKARQARNAYARRWRAQNKEKVKAANERYWARRAERETQQVAQIEGRKEDDTDAEA